MSNITRRGFFRLSSVVGGAIVFNIEIKQPFAKLLAEKIMQHPAARKVDVSYYSRFRYDAIIIRATYWSEKHQQRLWLFMSLDQELYNMPGSEAADMASDSIAHIFHLDADYKLKAGPDSGVAGFVF